MLKTQSVSSYIIGLTACDLNGIGQVVLSSAQNFPTEFIAPKQIFKFNSEITPSVVGSKTVLKSLSEAKISLDEVDFFISCTQTPDLNNPSLAQSILGKLNKTGIGGIELKQSTVGSLYAIDLASKLVSLGTFKCVLICATEFLSRMYAGLENIASFDSTIRQAAAISSDGCAALLVVGQDFLLGRAEQPKKLSILQTTISCSGEGLDAFYTPYPSSSSYPLRLTSKDVEEGRHLTRIDRNKFIAAAQKHIPRSFAEFRDRTGISADNVHAVINHSPIADLWKELGFLPDVPRFDTFSYSGFVSSVGIPLGLNSLIESGELTANARVLAFAVGSGLQWGFSLLEVH